MTKHIYYWDKSMLVVTEDVFCHDKNVFVTTKLLSQ